MFGEIMQSIKKEFRKGKPSSYSCEVVGDSSIGQFSVKFKIYNRSGYLVADSVLRVNWQEHKDDRFSIVISCSDEESLEQTFDEDRFPEIIRKAISCLHQYRRDRKAEWFLFRNQPSYPPNLEQLTMSWMSYVPHSTTTIYVWSEEERAENDTFPYDQIVKIIEEQNYIVEPPPTEFPSQSPFR